MTFSLFDKLRGMWELLRPVNSAVLGLGLNVGMVLAGSYQKDIPFIFYIYIFLAGFFVTGHAMVVNDIIDIDIDQINEPGRVLPRGIISVKTAWVWSLLLAVAGIFFFILVDIGGFGEIPYLWAYGLAHIVLADVYNYKLKQTGLLGNITVAWTAYAPFLGADLFLNGHLTLIPQTIGLIAIIANLSREIYKGIIDQEGDAEHNIRTLAVRYGATKAKFIATSILTSCNFIALYAFFRLTLIGKIGMIVIIVLFSYTIYLARDAEDPDRSRLVKTYLLMIPLIAAPFLILDSIFPLTLSSLI